MDKRILIAGVAAFLVSLLFSFVAHGVLLHGDYAQLPNLMRTEADATGYFPYLLLSHLIKGMAFAWVFAQGISLGSSWVNQGVRFGVVMALLITVPLYLVYYSVQPMPGTLVAKQIVLDSVGTILMAMAVAFVFRKRAELPA